MYFECTHGVFLATNNNSIEGLFGAPFGAFNATNSGDIKGGIKDKFRGVVAPPIGTYYNFDFKKEREIKVKGSI